MISYHIMCIFASGKKDRSQGESRGARVLLPRYYFSLSLSLSYVYMYIYIYIYICIYTFYTYIHICVVIVIIIIIIVVISCTITIGACSHGLPHEREQAVLHAARQRHHGPRG